MSGLPLQSVTVCTGNATAASLGMGAARAMEATRAPGVTKVNTLGATEGLGEQPTVWAWVHVSLKGQGTLNML